MNSNAAITEPQFIDPISFKKISLGDRVRVLAPSGAAIDFTVTSIDTDNLVLGPLTHKELAATKDSVVLSAVYSNPQSGFKIKDKDLVTITDKSGRKFQMRVDLIIGNEFIVLDSPTNKKKIGLWDKLKFIWNMAKK